MISAVMIDSREPEWVQRLTFGGVPASVLTLEVGDLQAVTDSGELLIIERKTPDDLLNSLADERLMLQMSRMVSERLGGGWPYLVITGMITPDGNGKAVVDSRGATGWNWNAVQGALLTIQEMGIFVVYAQNESDYEACVLRLGEHKRGELKLLPRRNTQVLGTGAGIIASLPGIGVDRVMEVLKWAGNKPAHAIIGLTDLDIEAPVGTAVRKKIRNVLGLAGNEQIIIWNGETGEKSNV